MSFSFYLADVWYSIRKTNVPRNRPFTGGWSGGAGAYRIQDPAAFSDGQGSVRVFTEKKHEAQVD